MAVVTSERGRGDGGSGVKLPGIGEVQKSDGIAERVDLSHEAEVQRAPDRGQRRAHRQLIPDFRGS